jgi:hypothetical protein
MLLFYEILILNLKQKMPSDDRNYMTAEDAYEALKSISEEDFGYDAGAWEKWFTENDYDVSHRGYGNWVKQLRLKYNSKKE